MIQFQDDRVCVVAYSRSDVDEFMKKNEIGPRRCVWVTDPESLRGLGRGAEVYFLPRYTIRQENYLILDYMQNRGLVHRLVRHDLVSLWDKPGYVGGEA